MDYNIKMETYQRGRTEPHSKCGCREIGTWVRTPPSPPIETHTKQIERFVSYFYLWDCFGFVVNFERPKIDNVGWQNWKTQKRDELGNFCK